MSQSKVAHARLDIARAYRGLFLEEDGTLKPEAETVLRDLERECGWMVKAMKTTSDGSIDPLRLAADYEKRRIYAHIKECLFADLVHLKRLTEKESD